MTSTRKSGGYMAMIAALTIAAVGAAADAEAAPPTGSSSGSGLIDTGSAGTGSFAGGSAAGGSGSASPRTQLCNASTESGGAGVTDTIHELGKTGPISFVLSYETKNIPDQIQVFYEGSQVYNTGYVGDNINEGTGSAVVTLPPGIATSVLVRVTGPDATEWSYTVHCPV